MAVLRSGSYNDSKKYNFISGLPRAGSTLLSSILNQNPRFTASIRDPLAEYAKGIITQTHMSAGDDKVVSVEKRKRIIRGIFDSFYADDNEVCFNTNRGWTSDTPLLKDLYPNFKMIVMVRDVQWILNSFEILNNKNPYTVKPLYHNKILDSVYDRCNLLMGGVSGYAGYVYSPLLGVKHAISCLEKDNILFVHYDALVKKPTETMKYIYRFIGEPWFEHDFNNVACSYDEFDFGARIEGLHTVRSSVEYKEQPKVIPDDLWKHYESQNFWKHINKNKLNWIE